MQLGQATQRLISVNHGGPRGARTRGLVLHIAVADWTADQAAAYFATPHPDNPVSSHFYVDYDGNLIQLVDTDDEAWAQMAGNAEWISVETAGVTDGPWTDAQVRSLAVLFLALSQHYGFPLQLANSPGEEGLGYHAMGGQAWGGHPCPLPTRIAQRQQILNLAVGAANGGIPVANIQEDDALSDPGVVKQINDIANAVYDPNTGVAATHQAAEDAKAAVGALAGQLNDVSNAVFDPSQGLAVQVGKVVGMLVGLQLVQGGTVDMAAIEAAAEKGAQAALSNLNLVNKEQS